MVEGICVDDTKRESTNSDQPTDNSKNDEKAIFDAGFGFNQHQDEISIQEDAKSLEALVQAGQNEKIVENLKQLQQEIQSFQRFHRTLFDSKWSVSDNSTKFQILFNYSIVFNDVFCAIANSQDQMVNERNFDHMDEGMQKIFNINSKTDILRNMQQMINLTNELEFSIRQIEKALAEIQGDVVLKTDSMTGRKIYPNSGRVLTSLGMSEVDTV